MSRKNLLSDDMEPFFIRRKSSVTSRKTGWGLKNTPAKTGAFMQNNAVY